MDLLLGRREIAITRDSVGVGISLETGANERKIRGFPVNSQSIDQCGARLTRESATSLRNAMYEVKNIFSKHFYNAF